MQIQHMFKLNERLLFKSINPVVFVPDLQRKYRLAVHISLQIMGKWYQ